MEVSKIYKDKIPSPIKVLGEVIKKRVEEVRVKDNKLQSKYTITLDSHLGRNFDLYVQIWVYGSRVEQTALNRQVVGSSPTKPTR